MSTTIVTMHTLQDLKLLPQWVCYRPDKVPFQPSGVPAEADDPSTWSTYSEVIRAWKQSPPGTYAGIGFEFVKEQELTGIDLDKCIDDQGQISPQAQEIIERINSYTEYSPSRRGFHILVRGNIPKNIGADTSIPLRIEMYDCKHYFTMTGYHLNGTPETFEDRHEELLALHQEVTEQRRQAKAAKHQAKQPPEQRVTRATIGGDTPYGLAALDRECQDVATTAEGGRNSRLNAAAYSLGQLVGGNMLTRSTVERELYHAADRCGLSDNEIEKTLRSGLEAGIKEPRTAPVDDLIYGTSGGQGNGNGNNNHRNTNNGSRPGPDPQFVLNCLHEGEYGDAHLFSYLFRGLVLYDHTAKEWYTWSGHWWEEDTTEKIKHLVSGKLASVYIKAGADLNTQASQQEAKAEASGDEQEKEQAAQYVTKVKGLIKELSGRAFSLRQISRCKNVLNFASSYDGMGIKADRWDNNPWLLAVPNGVIDLKTGLLRDGRPEDYIRTVCPTVWKGSDTPAPRWERFLQEIFELKLAIDGKTLIERTEDELNELIRFIQRLLGYGITGEVVEHIFTVFYGEDGRNGKDTIQRAVSRTLGAASTAISKDVLLDAGRTRAAGAPTPHLSDLQGKRLAWASEPEKGARFNVGQIKELSGGGEIPTRGLHEKKFTKIQPSHLLILLTNHKPHADTNDTPFWDRLRLITFNMRFVDNPVEPNERKKDTQLWGELELEASGILAWLVRGCLEWQHQGLNTPQSVLEDGKQYRKEEDDLSTFLEECCLTGEKAKDATVKASRLYAAYEQWAKAGNLYVVNKTVFGLQLGKKKYQKETTRAGVIYKGLGLLTEDGEESVNSFAKLFTSNETAPQAALDKIEASDREQCEEFKQVFAKNSTRESKNSEKPVTTIHTIHSTLVDSSVNQPVEPSEVGVNSLQNPSQTIHTPVQNDLSQRFLPSSENTKKDLSTPSTPAKHPPESASDSEEWEEYDL